MIAWTLIIIGSILILILLLSFLPWAKAYQDWRLKRSIKNRKKERIRKEKERVKKKIERIQRRENRTLSKWEIERIQKEGLRYK